MGTANSVASEGKDQEGPTTVSFFDPALKGVRGRVMYQLFRMGKLCARSFDGVVLAKRCDLSQC